MKDIIKVTPERLFVWAAFVAVLNIGVFGIFAPFLVSYSDTLLVLAGIFLCVATLYLDIKLITRFIKLYSKGDTNEVI